MIIAKRLLIRFDNNWGSDTGYSSISFMPGTMIPIPGLSPVEELRFRGFNAMTIHWGRFALTFSFKSLPKFDFHYLEIW